MAAITRVITAMLAALRRSRSAPGTLAGLAAQLVCPTAVYRNGTLAHEKHLINQWTFVALSDKPARSMRFQVCARPSSEVGLSVAAKGNATGVAGVPDGNSRFSGYRNLWE
jgi:hypothetical protein